MVKFTINVRDDLLEIVKDDIGVISLEYQEQLYSKFPQIKKYMTYSTIKGTHHKSCSVHIIKDIEKNDVIFDSVVISLFSFTDNSLLATLNYNLKKKILYNLEEKTWIFEDTKNFIKYENENSYISTLNKDELKIFGAIVCVDDSHYPLDDPLPWTNNVSYGTLWYLQSLIVV